MSNWHGSGDAPGESKLGSGWREVVVRADSSTYIQKLLRSSLQVKTLKNRELLMSEKPAIDNELASSKTKISALVEQARQAQHRQVQLLLVQLPFQPTRLLPVQEQVLFSSLLEIDIFDINYVQCGNITYYKLWKVSHLAPPQLKHQSHFRLELQPIPLHRLGKPDAIQQQQLQAQQQGMAGQPDPSLALHLAICTPSYFNNENDEVLRKWNQLQAFWGAGKGKAMYVRLYS
ncbi:hypothetical protein E2C01_003765 [Portunus trituberculatus]|uniref:Uncharacterized protein n=1 Tax=Portunus trituberculatus TaxID=210409 RepID=A0A5B7CN01_PORTR|nr:hypothetical protein [Portunus trituberculatus]